MLNVDRGPTADVDELFQGCVLTECDIAVGKLVFASVG